MKNFTFLSFKFCLILFITHTNLLSLQASENHIHPSDSVSKKKKNMKIVLLPVIYYTPETRWAFGALVQFLFKMNAEDTVSRTSTLQIAAIYTVNNQYLISPSYNLFFDQEKYWINGYRVTALKS